MHHAPDLDISQEPLHAPAPLGSRTILGQRVSLRRIVPEDTNRYRAFVQQLSYGTRYFRFGSGEIDDYAALAQLQCGPADITWRRFAATIGESGRDVLVASSCYTLLADEDACELTILVDDRWHGSRLAHWLLATMIDDARRAGIGTMKARVLGTNRRMLRFAERHGFAVETGFENASIKRLVLPLAQEGTP